MKKNGRRVLSFILTVVMVFTLLPVVGRPMVVKAETIPAEHQAHNGSCDHSNWTPISSEDDFDDLCDSDGNGYLTKDITVSQPIYFDQNTNLCLNGHSITSSSGGSGVFIIYGGTLNLFDESNNSGVITHSNSEINESGVEVRGGTFIMNGGKISGNTTEHYGAGVRVYDGNFTMTGGEISGNTADSGGGVGVGGGTFIMNGGKISGNTANSGGGGVFVVDGNFTMTGGEISGNTAYDYPGLYIYGFVDGDVFITDESTIDHIDSWCNERVALTFNSNEINNEKTATQYIKKDTDTKLYPNVFTITDKNFVNWNTSADGTGTSYDDEGQIKIGSDMTLYAQWCADAYTVKFDANGGSGEMPDQERAYADGLALTENAFSREGYKFRCWNTKADGSGIAYDDKSTDIIITNSSEITFYAQWTKLYKGNGKALQIGSDALGEGVNTDKAATLYFDSYDKGGTTISDAWRVIGFANDGVASDDGRMTLLAGSSLGKSKFDSNGSSNEYSKSTLKASIDGIVNDRLSVDVERNAVIGRTLYGESGLYGESNYNDNNVSGDAVHYAVMWPLSVNEANLLNGDIRYIGEDWWLRSPGISNIAAAGVNYGAIDRQGHNVTGLYYVRPAFNLNLSSIIFTSAAEGGKLSGAVGSSALMPVKNYTGDEWKLTIHDDSRDGLEVTRIDNGNNISSSCEIKIEYKNATTGTNNYLSAILVDSNNNILSYGRIEELPEGASSNGVAYITVPSNLTEGSTYTLKFMSEQYNGDKMTDFASKFESKREVSFTVGSNSYYNSKKAIQFGSDALGAGVNSSDAATLYYDSYLGADGKTKNSDAWKVIGYNTDGVASADCRMTLLAGSSLGKSEFDSNGSSNEYSKSTLKSTIDGIVNDRLSVDVERNAVIGRTLYGESGLYGESNYNDNNVSGDAVHYEVMWPLSVNEANLLNGDIRKNGNGDFWWLRSPGYNANTAAIVWDDGGVDYGYLVDHRVFVRPAFNLNLSSIIFTSAAEGGKSSGTSGASALTSIGSYTGNEWKVTLHDSSRDSFTVSRIGSDGIRPGGILRFSYSNAKTKADTGKDEYVSAMLFDQTGVPIYYGRIVDLTSDTATGSGTASVKIPEGLDGEIYTLQFFSEQYNGDKFTDYASDPNNATITFSLGKATPVKQDFTVSVPSNKEYDGTASKATVTAAADVTDPIEFEVKYYNSKGELLDGAPTEAGDYTFKVVVKENDYFNETEFSDEKWAFSISKITPEADDLSIAYPDLVYDGNAKEITVGLNGTLDGIGKITPTYYSNGETLTSAPVNVGEYTFTLDVDGSGNNFTGATGLSDENWKFSITEATPTVTDFKFTPPSDTIYDGTGKAVTIEPADGVNGMGTITVYYVDSNNTKSTIAPKSQGTYKVEIDVAKGSNYKAASGITQDTWTLTIGQATPASSDFTVSLPTNLTYDGKAKTATVKVKNGITGMGKFAVEYYKGNTLLTGEPVEPGTYTVKLNVAEGTNYNAAVDITDEAWTFTIVKATPSASDFAVVLPSDLTYDGTGKSATVTVKDGIAGMGSFAVEYYDSTGTEKLSSAPVEPGNYLVKVNVSEGDNYTSATLTDDSWKFTILSRNYNITLNTNKGTINSGNVKEYTYGVGATLPSDVTLTGNTFGGWYDNENFTGNAVTEISKTETGDKTFYAKWTPNAYTVKFDSNGGKGSMADQARVYGDNKTLTENAFTREGYTFTGWNTKADGSGTSYGNKATANLTSNAGDTVTLYAQWRANTYTVKFDANGGSGSMKNQNRTYDDGKSLSANTFTFVSHTFKNWNTASDGSGTSYEDGYKGNLASNAGATVILYAQWEDVVYTVETTNDGNGKASASPNTGINGTEITITATPDDGYMFNEWQVVSGGVKLADSKSATTTFTIGTENVVVKATFTKIPPKEYSVTVSTDGNGTANASVTSGIEGTEVTIKATADDGFMFKEWQVISGGVKLANAESAETTFKIGTSNVEVKAIFEEIPKKIYTVSFDANGGKGSMDDVKVEEGSEYILPECKFFAPRGRVFDKWNLGKAGETIVVNSDITLKAEWKSNVSVVDIFDDIYGDEWFVDFVQFVYDNGIMTGKGNIFDPNGWIRREELTQIIYSHAEKPALSENAPNPYSDVKNNRWYYKGIIWCYENGIVTGVGNNRFGVGQNVSRQDMVLMLYKYAQNINMPSINNIDENAYIGFKDSDEVSKYAITAMNWAITNGMIGGKGNADDPKSELRLDPKGYATRAEGAKIIMRFMEETYK